jgi:hypothetical protein
MTLTAGEGALGAGNAPLQRTARQMAAERTRPRRRGIDLKQRGADARPVPRAAASQEG